MKKIFLCLFFPLVVSANTLNIESSSLAGGQSTASTSFVDVLAVNYSMPHDGAALVLSTYSAEGDVSKGLTASWRIQESASSYSSTIDRYISSKSDKGIASSMHVFSGLSTGANSLSLQHKTSGGTMQTFGANLVVIPLVTSGGERLDYGLSTTSSAQGVSSTTTYTGSGLVTTVAVSRDTGNGIYIATSFNTRTSGSTAETFSSQLQYRRWTEAGAEVWINLGAGNQRSLSGANDTGAVTLYGAVDGLASDTYEVRVAGKTANANEVEVFNGEMAAVAMSYTTDGMDGGYFEMVGATSAGGENTVTSFTTIPGVLADVDVPTNANIFASMSFEGVALSGANQTSSFRLSITNETGIVQSTVENSRFFNKTDDYGSGGVVGVFTNLTAGTYTIVGEHDELNGPTITESITLVGFNPVAVPEPTTITLISITGLMALLWRRRFNT